jgi:hypothetical protein
MAATEEPLFVVRTERELFLFRIDSGRYTTLCYPITEEALARTQYTVYDLRPPSTEDERKTMADKQRDSNGRYIAMYSGKSALTRIGAKLTK